MTSIQRLDVPGAAGAAYGTGLDAPRIYRRRGRDGGPWFRLANDQSPNSPAYVETTIKMPGAV